MKPVLAAGIMVAMGLVASSPCHASLITYFATLSGPSESPPNLSPGIGSATVIVDTVADTMRVEVSFSGLDGTTTASNIHCCTIVPGTGSAIAATTTLPGFPVGVISGTYDNTLDLTLASSYNPVFVSATGGLSNAGASLLAGLAADEAYLDIQTTVVPGGEIRGFLAVEAIPEPAPLAILAAGLLGLVWGRKRFTH